MSLDESLELFRTLGDATRIRLLCLLEDEELTVAELQRVLDVPQSRVSTHLARLKEAHLAVDRIDGAHRYYRMATGKLSGAARAGWQAVRQMLDSGTETDRDGDGNADLARDRMRRDQVVAERRGVSESWVDRVAGSLDRHYSPGRTWESLARGLALIPSLGDVADLGCGDGALVELLAPRARSVVGIDLNEKMIAAGARRLKKSGLTQVRLIRGDMHDPPLPDESADFVLLLQTLQYADEPMRVFRQVARILRPGGDLLVVTLAHHRRVEVRTQYGHVHLGFTPAQLRGWMRSAHLETVHLQSAGQERRQPHFEALALRGRKASREST